MDQWRYGPRRYRNTQERASCPWCGTPLRKDNVIGVCRTHRTFSVVWKTNSKERYVKNLDKNREYRRNYSISHLAEKRIYDQERNRILAGARREYFRDYRRHKRQTDPLCKLRDSLRFRIWSALKTKYSKNKRTVELLGADIYTVKTFLESKFDKGMNWQNHGKWHIDHIIPLSSAKTQDELERLCHYTNLQPLWASENLLKSNKLGVNN